MINVLALIVLPALAALADVLWAAEGRHAFDAGEGSIEDVERRITSAGLQLCSTVDNPDGTANQAIRSRQYVVAESCGGDSGQLAVDEFEDVAHRDAAARNHEHQSRPVLAASLTPMARRRYLSLVPATTTSRTSSTRSCARPVLDEGLDRVKLGVLSLAMINVAAIVSARNLPVMAEYGWSMLALFAISILVFLVPIAMVAAELGTAWCKEGGVFAWVKEAFGGSASCRV